MDTPTRPTDSRPPLKRVPLSDEARSRGLDEAQADFRHRVLHEPMPTDSAPPQASPAQPYRNEAAKRLRELTEGMGMRGRIDAALAEERRRVVAQIRERVSELLLEGESFHAALNGALNEVAEDSDAR